MSNLKIVRCFEPQKRDDPDAKLNGYLSHPDRVRESVIEKLHDGTYQEPGCEGRWAFDNGFCRNYMGGKGIAWIVGDAPKGANRSTLDKFFPAPSELNEFYE